MVEYIIPQEVVTRYRCDICNHVYDTEEDAIVCENKPITKGFFQRQRMDDHDYDDWKIGDVMLIITINQEHVDGDYNAWGDGELRIITDTVQHGHTLFPKLGTIDSYYKDQDECRLLSEAEIEMVKGSNSNNLETFGGEGNGE